MSRCATRNGFDGAHRARGTIARDLLRHLLNKDNGPLEGSKLPFRINLKSWWKPDVRCNVAV
jgi:hypothetical protein